jgi:hypothetical protein
MSTSLLQTLSTAVLGACGIVALFAPEVFLKAINMGFVTPHWPVQLLAAAWLALAVFNGLTRNFAIGGIYGRPILLTNFTLYFVAATSTLRPALANGRPGPISVLVIAGIFAAAYGYLLFARGPAAGTSSPAA